MLLMAKVNDANSVPEIARLGTRLKAVDAKEEEK